MVFCCNGFTTTQQQRGHPGTMPTISIENDSLFTHFTWEERTIIFLTDYPAAHTLWEKSLRAGPNSILKKRDMHWKELYQFSGKE